MWAGHSEDSNLGSAGKRSLAEDFQISYLMSRGENSETCLSGH
jgi:hypothetical protein